MRTVFRISLGLLVLLLLVPVLGWLWLGSTLPRTTGTTTLDALQNDVEIVRDTHGVPHIFAPTWRDAYVALGYVHAQDRLWQMELTRRYGAGRLAEIVGKPALKSDQLMRTLGLYEAAYNSYTALSLPVQTALQAYAEGVNAFIAEGPLPPEYSLAGFQPEPWQPADSLVWIKLMAYTLGSGWRQDLTAAALATKLPPDAVAVLMGWHGVSPAMVPDEPETPAIPKLFDKQKKPKPKSRPQTTSYNWAPLMGALPPLPLGSAITPASASNAWAAGDRRSQTAEPILANDPHLMLTSPALWYLARVETPEGSLVGATAPGVPFHIAGMNNDLAWGLTTTGADTSDVFVEKIGNVPELYVTPNGPEAFLTRREVIKVKGHAPVILKVRQTRHGPVIGDLVETNLHNEKTTVSMQATYLRGDDTSAEALYWMGRATTVNELEMALRFVQAPVQNVTFVERRGNIGMFTAGTVPVRARGDGAFPAPGDDARYDWVGVVPRHELPRIVNPSRGVVSNANEAVVDDAYPYHFTAAWDPGYRGQRIKNLLEAHSQISLKDFRDWQNDTLSLPDLQLRDVLLDLLRDKDLDDDSTRLVTILRAWDGHTDLDQIAPTIMAVWQEQLANTLLADDVGDMLQHLQPVGTNILLALLRDPKHDWCDDTHTNAKEDCQMAAMVSLRNATTELKNKLGNSEAHWQWRYLNIAPMTNKSWDAVPIIGKLLSNSMAVAGGQYTLKRAGRTPSTNNDDMYAVNHGAGYRGIYDLSNPADSQFIIATGQSGHVLSPYYNDLRKLWANGGYVTLTGTLSELEKAGGDYMTLKASHAKNNSQD